jgi:predicted deacylase
MKAKKGSGRHAAHGRPGRPVKPAKRTKKGANDFELGGWRIEPGTRRRVEIRLGEMYNQAPLGILATVVRGTRPGPRLWISGGVHGDELLGIVAVREVLTQVDPENLAGTLVAIPCVNELGVMHRQREFPDGRDLNRMFPGSMTGSFASRVARAFLHKVALKCTHGIDLHTAGENRDNLPQIRANLTDPETARLARAFGAPVMIHAGLREGSLRQAASARGVTALLYEAGQPLRHEPDKIRVGVEGVLRVMAALRMIKAPVPPRKVLTSWRTGWDRAPRSGYYVPSVDLGDRVEMGQSIGAIHLRSLVDETARELNVRSTRSGIVVGMTRFPLVHVGDPMVHVADLSSRAKH